VKASAVLVLAAALLLGGAGAGCNGGEVDSRRVSGTVIRRAIGSVSVDAGPDSGGDGAGAADATDGAGGDGESPPSSAVTLARRGDILCSTSSGVTVLGSIDSFTGDFSLAAPPDEILACWRIDAAGRLYPLMFLDGLLALPPDRIDVGMGAVFPAAGFFVVAVAAGAHQSVASSDPAALAGAYDLQADDGNSLGLRLIDRGTSAGGDGAGRWVLVLEDAGGACGLAVRAQVQTYGSQVFIGAVQGDGEPNAPASDTAGGGTAVPRLRLGLNGVLGGGGEITGYFFWIDNHPRLGFAGPEAQSFLMMPRGGSADCSNLDMLLVDLPGCAGGCALDAQTAVCQAPGGGPCDALGPVLARSCPAGCAVNELALCWDATVEAACCLDASWCPGSCLCQGGFCVEPDEPDLACQQ
jgi:hypothetical protein